MPSTLSFQLIPAALVYLLHASPLHSSPAGYGPKADPCTTQLVPIPRQACTVEYDKTCIVRPRAVEHVSGYTRGQCKQVVREKCYRRVRGEVLELRVLWILFFSF